MSAKRTPQPVYPPKSCAFHPSEMIFNFCRNKQCLLPLCPTCIDLHTQEHKNQKTYGKFQNLSELVEQMLFKFQGDLKQLSGYKQQIEEQLHQKSIDQSDIRRKVNEAKDKVIGLVQRFFDDFDKQVQKSVKQFNVSMRENYRQMSNQIQSMENQINLKTSNLHSDKVLKTIIAYYAKQEGQKVDNNIQVLRDTLQLCGHKRVNLVSENSSINKMINQLSKYMYLSFQNWENQHKYEKQFVKTGFTHKTQVSNTPTHRSNRSRVSHQSSHSRTCSINN